MGSPVRAVLRRVFVKADRSTAFGEGGRIEEILAHFCANWSGAHGILGYAAYRVVWGTPFTVNMLANRQAVKFLIANPELFSRVGIADGTILDWHSGKLAPVGVTQRDAIYAQAESSLSELRRFDRSKLSRQDQITYDVLADFWQSMLVFRRFDWLSSESLGPTGILYPVSPSGYAGIRDWAKFLLSNHVIKNGKTARIMSGGSRRPESVKATP